MISLSFSKIKSSKQAQWALIVLSSAFILALSYFQVFEHFELRTYDSRFQLRGVRPFSTDIVFIDIWDDTLEALGQWPIGREYHAGMIEILSKSGARSVVFDIEFVEPNDKDALMVSAAKKARNVFFAFGFKEAKLFPTGNVADSIQAKLLKSYEEVAKGEGFVNTSVDRDGKWRRMMPVIHYKGNIYYQLAIRAAMDYLGVDPEGVVYKPFEYIELKPGYRIPLDAQDCLPISYAGTWKEAFRHYSYKDILVSYAQVMSGEKPLVDLKHLRGKICLIGLTAQGTHDMKPTPLEPIYPGVGLYASVISSIITQDYIHRLGRFWNMMILLVLGLFLARVAFYKKPLTSFTYAVALISIFILTTVNIFLYYGLWIDLFYPTFVLVGVYIFGTLTRIISEMRKRELMESELKIASQIQKSFLPAAPPEVKGLSLSVFMQPAKHVGGDLYAFIKLPDDKIGVMLGDVSGKGTPAALFMGKVVSEFKFSARDRVDPSEVLTNLNNSISAESTGGLFVTLAYAVFDLKNMKMILSNGGHLPLVTTYADKRTELITCESGMPIGVMEGVPFANIEVPIAPGQSFALYSDGISEARNRKKDEFGVEELQKVMLENHKKTSQEILDQSVEKVKLFAGKAEQHDDMTMIVVQVLEEPKA